MRAARGCRQPGGLILTLGSQASGESAHQINSWWFDSRNEWEPFVAIEPLGREAAAGRVRCERLSVAVARQPDRHRRAAGAGAGDVDGAAMFLDDLADGRQAEADAEALGGEQGLEDV